MERTRRRKDGTARGRTLHERSRATRTAPTSPASAAGRIHAAWLHELTGQNSLIVASHGSVEPMKPSPLPKPARAAAGESAKRRSATATEPTPTARCSGEE